MADSILLFDDWGLHYRRNLDRALGQPEPVPEATLTDELTEGTWNFPTVWYDDRESTWKAVYIGAVNRYPVRDAISYYRSEDREIKRDIALRTQVLLYAESDDGIHWEKPDLSDEAGVEVGTRVAKNQVFDGGVRIDDSVDEGPRVDGGPVFVDRHEPDPERRLKFIYTLHTPGTETDRAQRLATSPDGLRWTVEREFALGHGQVDAPMCVYYHDESDAYSVVHRTRFLDRRVAVTKTDDFRSYTDSTVVVSPDPEDPPLVQFYGMPVFPYEGMYVGLLWRLHTDPTELGHKIYGRIDCSLTYSYNGEHFNRATHDPFVPAPPPGDHGGGSIYPSSMVRCEDGIRFYSGGSKAEHFRDQDLDDAALLLHRLRTDGFAYLETTGTRGELLTRPLVFHGDDLSLNVKSPYGTVRTQVVGLDGVPLEGLTYDDAAGFTGDAVEHTPEWTGDRSLSDVGPDPVYLGVEIAEGRIYAVRGDFEVVPGILGESGNGATGSDATAG